RRAVDRDVEHLPREGVRRTDAAADERGARAEERGVEAVRAARPELDHALARRRLDHASRLGGDERLMVDGGEEERLDELPLDDRRAHLHQGLTGEDDGAFGYRVHVAAEAERR